MSDERLRQTLPLMPDLAIGSASWRAARAAAVLGPWLDGSLPTDTALGFLEALGAPPEGWWDTLGSLRAALSPAIALTLPRPGDPRGIAWPPGSTAITVAGLHWSAETDPPRGADGRATVLPIDATGRWLSRIDLDRPVTVADRSESERMLKREIVRAAHVLDLAGMDDARRGDRLLTERTVDSWLLSPPALRHERRSLAATSLRLLLALQSLADDEPRTLVRGVEGVDARALEAAARAALEASYSIDDPSR